MPSLPTVRPLLPLLVVVALLGLPRSGARAQLPPGHPRLSPLDTSREIRFYLQPVEGQGGAGHRASDVWLALTALAAWQRAAGGTLRLVESTRDRALLHLYWVTGQDSLYGEMRPIQVNGLPGAAVLVRPVTEGLGPEIAQRAARDPLFRDTVVYLTCLHELGHAFGMPHTADFRDIMYSFQHGGDIPGFFGRYRDQIRTREDIARVSGLSEGDLTRLRRLLRPPPSVAP